MKKAFFSIALAALTVASCSRDNDDSTPTQNQEQTNPNLQTVANLDASICHLLVGLISLLKQDSR